MAEPSPTVNPRPTRYHHAHALVLNFTFVWRSRTSRCDMNRYDFDHKVRTQNAQRYISCRIDVVCKPKINVLIKRHSTLHRMHKAQGRTLNEDAEPFVPSGQRMIMTGCQVIFDITLILYIDVFIYIYILYLQFCRHLYIYFAHMYYWMTIIINHLHLHHSLAYIHNYIYKMNAACTPTEHWYDIIV